MVYNNFNTLNISLNNKKKVSKLSLPKKNLLCKLLLKNNLIKNIEMKSNLVHFSFYKNKPKFKHIKLNSNDCKYSIK